MATATQLQVEEVPQQLNSLQQAISSKVCARVGLLGNPSDGFYGKTISFSLANFYAEVRTVTDTACAARAASFAQAAASVAIGLGKVISYSPDHCVKRSSMHSILSSG